MKILLSVAALWAAAVVAVVFPDMKKILLLIPFALLALSFAGCASNPKKVTTFISQLPALDMTGASQDFSCPLWSNSESVESVAKTADGQLKITTAKVTFKIPLWGVVSGATINSIIVNPSAVQIAAAKAIVAAAPPPPSPAVSPPPALDPAPPKTTP